jgi:hypothetical protein
VIDKRILRLTPKRILCPLCGEWHDWEGKTLQSYDEYNSYEYECNGVTVSIWVDEDHIRIYADSPCDKLNSEINVDADLRDMEYDGTDPVIKIPFSLEADEIICESECEDCEYCDCCNFATIGDNRDDDEDEYNFELEFKFEFASRYFNKYSEAAREEKLRQQREAEEAKRQEELARQREAEEAKRQEELARQHEAEETKRQEELARQREAEEAQCQEELARQTKSKTTNQVKEETTMANNFFNMNMEFGPNKDENIASTLMGVAVKNGDSWRIYDKKTKQITDIGDMQLGNLPIFILPTTKLSEGDLIKDAGEYYFVMKVAAGSTQTLCAKTGEMKTVIPIKNVLGFSCYSKVIALSDSINMGGDFDVEKLAIMSTMCGQPGQNNNQMNQLLPLMLFKDKLGGDDDMMKMMLMSSMMSAPAEDGDQNATMNQLLPLMLFKDKLGGDDDMMKMMLMSSMMGGNMAGNNNPGMSYLMLDMFMGKKKDEKAQQPAQTPPPQNPAE